MERNDRPVVLEVKGIIKEFFGIKALKGVNFQLQKGEVLGLVGENGAGKSTLMKIISGIYPAGQFQGQIFLDGRPVQFKNTKDAEKVGIAIIHQELNLFPELTVAENIFLSHLPKGTFGQVDFDKIYQETEKILQRLEVPFTAYDKVGDLNIGHQQLVEIAKALSLKAQILILDEPTSSLTPSEIQNLYRILQDLQAKGVSCIYISHKLDEIYFLSKRATVLRDGQSIATFDLQETSQAKIIQNMVGREIQDLFPPMKKSSMTEEAKVPFFEVRNWTAYKITEGKIRVKNASFQAYPGEILGISGLNGAGRTDLLLSLFGHQKYRSEGKIFLEGKEIQISSPLDAIKNGIGYVSEDRKGKGLHLNHSILDNLTLTVLPQFSKHGLIEEMHRKEFAATYIKKLKTKIGNLFDSVKTLSGGNQQKISIAKWLAISPKVLFLDEPTRGIDVGAKWEIYSLLNQLVDEGVCVVIASSELPELMGLCHRIIVMAQGELVKSFEGHERVETEIMKAAIGAMG